ncbi:MAG: autotransporter domain-containing protein [Elusimicrobiota bacterium]|jgi:hypothetical protein|nr:autotransporter domain-containing protein [Elusimicrobiota bacterium]
MKKNNSAFIFVTVFVIFAISIAIPTFLFARASTTVYSKSGKALFVFDIADKSGEGYASGTNPTDENLLWTPVSQHTDAFADAGNYWAQLLGDLPTNKSALNISVGVFNDPNDISFNMTMTSGNTLLTAGILNNYTERYTEWGNNNYAATTYSVIEIGLVSKPYLDYLGQSELIEASTNIDNNWIYKPMGLIPDNRLSANFAAIIVHELGHSIGMVSSSKNNKFGDYLTNWDKHLYDSFGNSTNANSRIIINGNNKESNKFVLLSNGYAFFQGNNVKDAIGVETVFKLNNPNDIWGIPITGFEGFEGLESSEADLSHPELRNSMMSHQNYRNWNTYMEAELAMLQDIGINLDRRDFYGGSLYKDSVSISTTIIFYKRKKTNSIYSYDTGKYNDSSHTIGYHIYGISNTVTLSGEILSSGAASAGMRIDGYDNKVNIAANIHADGQGSAGLLVAYGVNHEIVHRGTFTAMGTDGTAVRFDFGDNLLGDMAEYRGSYKKIRKGDNSYTKPWYTFYNNKTYSYNNPELMPYELKGALVNRFDITGAIQSASTAIYISNNAYVKEINIMNGAKIEGNIISNWGPTNYNADRNTNPYDYIDYSGAVIDLTTTLTFGYKASADGSKTAEIDNNFNLNFSGNITGKTTNGLRFLTIKIVGGTLTYSGNISGVSKIEKTSAGLFAFSGDGSIFNGTFSQSTGTVLLSSKMFNGTNNITGGTFKIGNNASLSTALSLSGNSSIEFVNTDSFVLESAKINGNQPITKSGYGTLTITGNYGNYTGIFYQSSGTTIVQNKFFAGISSITAGILNIATNQTLTFSNKLYIGEAAILSKSGTADLTLTGNAGSFKGAFTQSAGRTIFQDQFFSKVSTVTSGILEFANSQDKILELTGNLYGTANAEISKTGNGILKITGDESIFTGSFSQKAGITLLLSKMFGGVNSITGGTFQIGDGASWNGSLALSGTSNLEFLNDSNFSLGNSKISGNRPIVKNGYGILTITGDYSSYSGNFTQNLGTTIIQNKFFSSDVTISSGTLKFDTSQSITFNGNLSGSTNAVIEKAGNSILTLTGNESVFAGIFKQTAGTTTASQASFFSGINNIQGGFVELANVLFGGALYTKDSTLKIGSATFTNNNSKTFQNNEYKNVYLDSNSIVEINAASFEGGILSNRNASGIIITKIGNEMLKFSGTNEIYGNFGAQAGTVKLSANSSLKITSVTLGKLAIFDLQNEAVDKISFDRFMSSGTLKMDVMNSDSDQIKSNWVQIDGGTLCVKSGFGKYNNKSFTLIDSYYMTALSTFNYYYLVNENPDMLTSAWEKSANSIIVTLNGSIMPKFNLDKHYLNAFNVAKVLTMAASDLPSDNPLMQIANKLEASPNIVAPMTNLSGYFLANVIRGSTEVDLRNIYNGFVDSENNIKLWTQIEGKQKTLKPDENFLGNYISNDYGFLAGVNKYVNDGITVGAFVKYHISNIVQDENTADGNKKGLGVYGVYVEEKYEIKAALPLSFNDYNIQRELVIEDLGDIAKSKFNSFGIGADLEFDLKYKISQISLKPFVGFNFQNLNYNSFSEESAIGVNLITEGASYNRALARFGIKTVREGEAFTGHLNLEGNCLLAGSTPKVKTAFDQYLKVPWEAVGTKENIVSFGVNVGGTAKLSKNFNLFADIQTFFAQNHQTFSGNIGVNYNFSAYSFDNHNRNKKKKPKKSIKTIKNRAKKPASKTDNEIEYYYENNATVKHKLHNNILNSLKNYLSDIGIIQNYDEYEISDVLFEGTRIRGWVEHDKNGNILNPEVLLVMLERKKRNHNY